jgi:hypothetical protein
VAKKVAATKATAKKPVAKKTTARKPAPKRRNTAKSAQPLAVAPAATWDQPEKPLALSDMDGRGERAPTKVGASTTTTDTATMPAGTTAAGG